MKVSTLAPGLLAGTVLAATRPMNTSVCDYYTTALLKDNTAKNQATVLTLLVNTAVLGSAVPKPKIDGVTFPTVEGLDGILAPNATYMGKPAVLAPYFSGALASSNRGGSKGVSVNFLDGGGASPLEAGMAANSNATNSNQAKLLTHLYQFFGTLLNCSQQGKSSDFAKYEGETNMYEVHKFMALNSSQVGYFISQVGLAAKSFGVSDDDVTYVGTALTNLFDKRCSPATEVIPGAGKELQAICITSDCQQSANATCDKYESVVMPMAANGTSAASGTSSSGSMASATSSGSGSMGTSGTGTGSGTASGTSSGGASSTPSSGVAAVNVGGVVAAGGIAALAFFL